jgi:hypothetical protein
MKHLQVDFSPVLPDFRRENVFLKVPTFGFPGYSYNSSINMEMSNGGTVRTEEGQGAEELGEKPEPLSFCPPQISHR